jgi:predicted cupin superfamily sugar epimerase
MHPRAVALIETLELVPHPEGGHFREVHRSSSFVDPGDHRGARAALTVIYFLLVDGEISRLHRVMSDETWHFHEGGVLELIVVEDAGTVRTFGLGPCSESTGPVHVVPAGAWQAARTTGPFTLVSCSVGPGFEFDDFEMMRHRPEASELRRRRPELAAWI